MKVIVFFALVCFSVVAGAESPDQRTTTDRFQDWTVQCVEIDKNQQCRASQQLVNQQGQVVAVVNIIKNQENAVTFELGLPLLVDLTKGVDINVDNKRVDTFSYSVCNAQACFVLVEKEKLFNAMKKGNTMQISYVPYQAKAMQLSISLKGFSSSLNALQER